MKSIVICFAAILGIASLASAATICAAGTLATYEALGSGGCTIGTNTVFGFSNPTGISGAVLFSPQNILVTPNASSSSPSLTFAVTAFAGGSTLIEALISYSISGNQYTGASIALAGSSATGNGAVTDIQNYCIGGTFDATGVSNCSTGNAGVQLLLGNGSTAATFLSTPRLNVTDDLTFDAGGAGAGNAASGGSITDTFTATAASGVPEPGTCLFLAGGLILLILRKTTPMFGNQERM